MRWTYCVSVLAGSSADARGAHAKMIVVATVGRSDRRLTTDHDTCRTAAPAACHQRITKRSADRHTPHAGCAWSNEWPALLEDVMSRTVGMWVVVVATALLAIACGDSSTSATTISSLAITGTAPRLGATAQFSAIATMGDG